MIKMEKEDISELPAKVESLIKQFKFFRERVGDDIYYSLDKNGKFFFSVEITPEYSEFYGALGHSLIAVHEQNYAERVLQRVQILCEKLESDCA